MGFAETAKFPAAIAAVADLLNAKNGTPSNTTPITLAAQILSSDVSMTVATGTGDQLPTDNFTVSIDDEIIFVSARGAGSDSLTGLTRGFEGTAPALHAIGATVSHRVTAKTHNQLAVEINAIETALGVNLANVGSAGSSALNVIATNADSHSVSTSTTAAQTILSETVPANELNVLQRHLRLTCGGVISTGTTSPNVTITVTAGSVQLWSGTLNAIGASLTNVGWFLDLLIGADGTGTTATVRTTGTLGINTATIAAYQGNTVDLTAAEVINIQVSFSVASASNVCAIRDYTLVRIGA